MVKYYNIAPGDIMFYLQISEAPQGQKFKNPHPAMPLDDLGLLCLTLDANSFAKRICDSRPSYIYVMRVLVGSSFFFPQVIRSNSVSK